ncbi:hypothetical protein [Congregibacter sp.]|uniref:hypothetical protein n=1 Tax=Congregibacter sp. TaxID=2744308 RepID=UPI003F6D64E2
MQNLTKQWATAVAMCLLVSQGSWGSNDVSEEYRLQTQQSGLMSAAFESEPSEELVALDDHAMRETQGELWPWIIGVAALDISLASFFWGEYVPIMAAAGGACITCDIGTQPR